MRNTPVGIAFEPFIFYCKSFFAHSRIKIVLTNLIFDLLAPPLFITSAAACAIKAVGA